LFIETTWVPELLVAPPILYVTASSLVNARRLFRLLHAVCRRAIIRQDFSSRWPPPLRPTLLLENVGTRKNVRGLWMGCDCCGANTARAGGGQPGVACSKVIYSNQEALSRPGEGIMMVNLLHDLPEFRDDALEEIAAEFQPQFEFYRLRSRQRKLVGETRVEIAGRS
jgi:hypothetical protein